MQKEIIFYQEMASEHQLENGRNHVPLCGWYTAYNISKGFMSEKQYV